MKIFDMVIKNQDGTYEVKPIQYRSSFQVHGYTFAVHKRYYPPEITVKEWDHEWDVSEISCGGKAFSGYPHMRNTVEAAKERLNLLTLESIKKAVDAARVIKEGI
jgi:hypothetical protein